VFDGVAYSSRLASSISLFLHDDLVLSAFFIEASASTGGSVEQYEPLRCLLQPAGQLWPELQDPRAYDTVVEVEKRFVHLVYRRPKLQDLLLEERNGGFFAEAVGSLSQANLGTTTLSATVSSGIR